MSEIDSQSLYLAYPADRCPAGHFDIKHQETGEIAGYNAIFTVIGSSHCITVPELSYCEIASCEPIETEPAERLPLILGMARTVRYDSEHLTAHTKAEVRPLSAFPDPDTFDISYQFGPCAYTTIHQPESDTYETYHTYPERDIALYTRTQLTLADTPTDPNRTAKQMQRLEPLSSE
jgi:hypothetical protein